MKKYLSLALTVVLAVGVLAGCAGQSNLPAPGAPSAPVSTQAALPAGHDLADRSFTSEEYEKLLALRFDGYKEMTVAEFRDEVGAATDTDEYRHLFERISESAALFDQKDTNETAAFLFYTLMPLTDDNWQTKAFCGAATASADASAILEYGYTLTIKDETVLTIREYNDAQAGIAAGLQTLMDNKTADELQNDSEMQETIISEIAVLTKLWGSEKLQVEIEYVFRCEDSQQQGSLHTNIIPAPDTEPRWADYGTVEDYRSLLALKTADYQNMSVADFNAKLLAWADEDFARTERIDADMQQNDFHVDLSEEERSFVWLTVLLSGTENGEFVQSNYTNLPEADPAYYQNLPQKLETDNQRPIWCDFSYQYSYHIADKGTLTVGERDRCIGNMLNAVQKFWEETPLKDLLTMTKNDIASCLTSLAAEYSSDALKITIDTEKIHFDHTEENVEIP